MRIAELTEELLGEVRRVANLSLREDAITDESLRRVTFGDPNFSSRYGFVALEGGEVVGFAIGVRRLREPAEVVEAQRDLAWVKLFAVREEWRRRGVATALFNELEGRLREDGVRRVRICDYPIWYLFSGVDLRYEDAVEFLSRRGYRKVGEAVDYEVDLLRFYVPRRVANMDLGPVTVRRARHEDREAVLEWVKREFSVFWAYEANEGFKHAEPKLWVAEEGGEVVGFAVYGALGPDRFGPIGVSAKARARGIGSVLLFNCLRSMREEGQRCAVIPWTSHLFFYTQVPGISRVRHYWILEKELS